MWFAYSTHKTLEAAEAALESYFNSGEVCEAERPYIRRFGNRYQVMFIG